MTVTPFQITGAQLTNAAATYYTAPALNTAVIKQLTFCNTDTAAHTVTVYLVPNGGSAGVTNEVISARTIAAGDTLIAFECLGQTLLTGATLQAVADSSSKITINGGGVVIS